jgi:hypothetical protein
MSGTPYFSYSGKGKAVYITEEKKPRYEHEFLERTNLLLSFDKTRTTQKTKKNVRGRHTDNKAISKAS